MESTERQGSGPVVSGPRTDVDAEGQPQPGQQLRQVMVSLLAVHDEIVATAHDYGYLAALDKDDGRTDALFEQFEAALEEAPPEEIERISDRAQAQTLAALGQGAHYLKATWDAVVQECQWRLEQIGSR